MSVTQKIIQLLASWHDFLFTYRTEGQEAALAAAEYKRERAKFIVVEKDKDPKIAATVLEARADADDRIAGLYLRKLATEAAAGATQYALIKCRTEADLLRTEVVDERETNRLYADNGPGA